MARVITSGKQRGAILLMALVMMTILTITLGMAMQPGNTAGLRMKETELVYRGEHLAEGIRRFYFQKGRFPFDLEELLDEEPRFIRKLYTDPMTGEADWVLVYLKATDRAGVQSLSGVAARITGLDRVGEENSQTESEDDGPGLPTVDSVFRVNTRQITGVRSKSTVEGLKVYQDSRIYNDWLFSALPQPEALDLTKVRTP